MKSSIKTIRKRIERLAKTIVKVRDKNICQKCGEYVTGANCHASHIIPVSAGNQYKYDPDNMIVLCYHHHINWWHKNPIEASEWFKEKFPKKYERLFNSPRVYVKHSVNVLLLLEEELKSQLDDLLA